MTRIAGFFGFETGEIRNFSFSFQKFGQYSLRKCQENSELGSSPTPNSDTNDYSYSERYEDFRKARKQFRARSNCFDPEAYPEAVSVLFELTQLDPGTGGAVRAAQVLLNAYNGSRFPFDPSDLSYLDPDLRKAAFTVMWGRMETNMEPHEFYNSPEDPKRGGKVFEVLAERYPCRFMAKE